MCGISAINSVESDAWDTYDQENRRMLGNTDAKIDMMGGRIINQLSSHLIATSAPVGAGVSVELELEGTFGPKKPEFKYGLQGKCYIDDDNYIRGKIQSSEDGTARWNVGIGQQYEFETPLDKPKEKPKCREKK